MATTIEELNRKLMKEALACASVADRLRGLTAREILEEFPHDELLERMPIEERMKRLSVEQIEDYLRDLVMQKRRGR
jgi:hypothetical protein